ncbi:hypothetical protein [Thioclava sp.]|uniref:hypothetical protein n=1 Tax=Thioclava sp. TaxID=1933450 RepID=UPI0032428378
MADRPILFTGPMVCAILEGRKTQTRRVLKPQPFSNVHPSRVNTIGDADEWNRVRKPFAVGDRLWVRETFWLAMRYSYGTTPGGDEIVDPSPAQCRGNPVHYAADGDPQNHANKTYGPDGLRGGHFAAPDPYAIWRKHPSIHMPRWASRLTLIVEDVRVQRLQEISDGDAMAEGCHGGHGSIPGYGYSATPVEHFRSLWNSINGAGAWDANPWVVAVTFRTVHANIDALDKAA